MQECDGSLTVQDCSGLPDERFVSADGGFRLLRLADRAQELSAEPVAEEARELAARVAEGRFYVACVGQFKRGKSSLLNALVGYEVVPTGFVPVTAVPTVIRFGELRARVRMRDGLWREVAIPDLNHYANRSWLDRITSYAASRSLHPRTFVFVSSSILLTEKKNSISSKMCGSISV